MGRKESYQTNKQTKKEKLDKISKANPQELYTYELLSRKPESAPVMNIQKYFMGDKASSGNKHLFHFTEWNKCHTLKNEYPLYTSPLLRWAIPNICPLVM